MGNWYSTDSEIKMGKMYATEIEKSTQFITDPVVTEYVNRIGQNIVKNSDCKVPFTIKVIDSDEINAMALPGGFFYVNSGLILNADEEAELAGVMAHETAHVCAHHAVREQTRMNYVQTRAPFRLIMMTGSGWTGYGIYEADAVCSSDDLPASFRATSRHRPTSSASQYMYRAGYDPQAFISFFEKVQALEKRKPGLVAKAFSDHPQTPDRILHSQEEIAKILPARDEYTVTTSEFDDVKATTGAHRKQAPPHRHQGQEQAVSASRQHHDRPEQSPSQQRRQWRRPSNSPPSRRSEQLTRATLSWSSTLLGLNAADFFGGVLVFLMR